MKKIIFSIIGILVLIGAYNALNGKNQAQPATARIDIYEKTTNTTPCFEIKEMQNGKIFSTAEWMPKFGQQGYVIQKDGVSQELEITSISDKCKIDISLKGPWELKDKNDRSKGLKEHWVVYTKFAINGQNIITKSTPAWHNKSINHTITMQKGKKFNIKINWQKYYTSEQLKAKNMKKNILIISLSFLGMIIFLLYKYRRKICTTQIWKKLSKLQDFDLEEIITKKWQAISPISKKSFLWIFLITNIVFLFHSITWLWGDHDPNIVKYGMSIYNMLWCGRFTGGLIQQVFGGDLLPIINNIFCFAGFTFAMIYLAKYWKVPQTSLNYTLFGLFIILMPYTLSWLWYIKQTSLYWNIFFVIYALYISQRKTYTSSVIAIILMVISLGAYASIISTIAIVLLGRIWLDIIIEQKSIKKVFYTYLRTSVNILISVIIFKLILIYYDYAGKLRNGTPNTEYITFSELPEKIKLVLRSIKEIFYIQLPFIELPWKILVSIPLIYITYLIVKMQKKEKLCALGVLVIILLSSQITNFMAKADFSHKARIDFFSLPYIFTIFIVCCLRGKKGIKSIILILMCCSIWLCVLSAMRFQKAFYLGRQAEMQVYTDIISRIKQDKQFDIKRKYRMFSTSAKGMRKYFYRQQNQKWDEALLGDALIPHWDGKPVYNFYEAESYLSSYANIERKESIAHLSPFEIKHIADFVLNKAEPYPHKNSVYVDDKYIIVIYDEKGLNNAKRHIQARLKELENKHE